MYRSRFLMGKWSAGSVQFPVWALFFARAISRLGAIWVRIASIMRFISCDSFRNCRNMWVGLLRSFVRFPFRDSNRGDRKEETNFYVDIFMFDEYRHSMCVSPRTQVHWALSDNDFNDNEKFCLFLFCRNIKTITTITITTAHPVRRHDLGEAPLVGGRQLAESEQEEADETERRHIWAGWRSKIKN